MTIEPAHESAQPPYESLDTLLGQIPGPNGEGCRAIYATYRDLFETAPGSTNNHQAWEGGYADHITDAMNIAGNLYDMLASTGRELPFERSDALLVMFLHDLEKPFKYRINEQGEIEDDPAIPDKAARAAKRQEVMDAFGITLDAQQANAMHFVEGIRDHEYTNTARLMGELAGLCHCADILSARTWYNYPLPEGEDSWQGAARVNPLGRAMLASELDS